VDENPELCHYSVDDRAEVFDFLREVFPPEDSTRLIKQWTWRCEASPFTTADGPCVYLIRMGGKLVGMSAGFRLKLWMATRECDGEGHGVFVVHPDFRGRKLWTRVMPTRTSYAPVMFGWTRLPQSFNEARGIPAEPVRPLMRILDAGPLLTHFTHSRLVGGIGAAATQAGRLISYPMRHRSNGSNGRVVRLDRFDERIDALWERARRKKAMIIRDHRYLNWRYCDRPDATYFLYGFERRGALEGFMVTRSNTYEGMPWGFLVDFLVPEGANDVLAALIDEAVDELRRCGAAAVTCFVTDPDARATLMRRGFFPAPTREPVRFSRFFLQWEADTADFLPLEAWYVTMGDGDLELSP
jgi:GNAT superfamily N-acetyltransferase